MHARFRVGAHVLEGTILQSRGSLRDVRLRDGSQVVVHESLFLKPTEKLSEGKQQASFADYVIEAVAPFIAMGQPLRAGRTRVVGYDRVNGVVKMTEGGPLRELSIQSLLGVADVGSLLALESHRSKLERAGLVREGAPILFEMVETQRPFHVFMKTDPFRDVSRLYKGTVIEVVGYYKGAAVIEADGESFWAPLEPISEMDVKHGLKDADYYFNLDADRNLVPDPLQYLPSKPGLGQKPGDAKPGENWNVTPILQHVSGSFAPTPELGSEVENLLDPETAPREVKEGYGALFYFHDSELQGTASPVVETDAEVVVDRMLGEGDASLEALSLTPSDPDTVREEFVSRHTELYGRAPEPDIVDKVIGAARR